MAQVSSIYEFLALALLAQLSWKHGVFHVEFVLFLLWMNFLHLEQVVIIWVFSSELIQFIFDDVGVSQPLFLTFYSTALFSIYLLGFVCELPAAFHLLGAHYTCGILPSTAAWFVTYLSADCSLSLIFLACYYSLPFVAIRLGIPAIWRIRAWQRRGQVWRYSAPRSDKRRQCARGGAQTQSQNSTREERKFQGSHEITITHTHLRTARYHLELLYDFFHVFWRFSLKPWRHWRLQKFSLSPGRFHRPASFQSRSARMTKCCR